MNLKRINCEYDQLIHNMNLPEHKRVITNVQRVDNDFTISFKGPKGSYYENTTYTVMWVATNDYPFTYPNLYWVGNAPDHHFYRHESNSIMRLRETTTIANTDFWDLS
jgi:ubiquitin-protein ligase